MMTSNKPYLLRAFYEWIIDNNYTPTLVVDASCPACDYLQDYAAEGEIVFNIADTAIRDLQISNQKIEFKASFSGMVCCIAIPIEAITTLYAEENGEGIFFDGEDENNDSFHQTTQVQATKKTKKGPVLTVGEVTSR